MLLAMGMTLNLRDITQAYVQAGTPLARMIFAYPPKEIRHLFLEGAVFLVRLPLYGIPESGMHWYRRYSKFHLVDLYIETSIYDPCLFVTHEKEGPFGIVGMQTDDTLILGDEAFVKRENVELEKAKLIAKPIESLTSEAPLIFNGCKLVMDGNGPNIALLQKGQGQRLGLVDAKLADFKQRYLEQRARGAYVASICQPEATYDMSVAAQYQNPEKEQVTALNKRL